MKHDPEILAQNAERVSKEQFDKIADAQFEHRPEPLWAHFDRFVGKESQFHPREIPGRFC